MGRVRCSFNHGQTCCAGSRIYVQASIYDEFAEKFVKHIETLKLGNPLEHGTAQGPQVSQQQFDVCCATPVAIDANQPRVAAHYGVHRRR